MAAKLEKTATPGIYKRGSRYVVVWRRDGRQHKDFYRTLAEAREAKGNRQAGDRRPANKQRFGEYAREWVANCQGRTRRGFDEDTRKSYAAALEAHAIPHLGAKRMCDITREDINALIAKMQRQGLAPTTIARYLAPVRALFSDAEMPTGNPALRLTINAKAPRAAKPADKPKRVKVMTRAELGAVLAAIPERHRLVFEVMAGTGCRISEALGLDWSDLGDTGATLRIERQWYRGTLKPNTKTEAGARTVTLSPALARKLWDLGADATGPMFHTRTGTRLGDRNLRRVLDEAAGKAGVLGVSHHTFRHTHGSILLDEGWSIPEVSKRLGHADSKITAEVYSHAMPDRFRELSFLDSIGASVGNSWATQDPETAANVDEPPSAEIAG